MSKVLLVLEKMPEHCEKCPCFKGSYPNAYCGDGNKPLYKDKLKGAYEKPFWCKLKHLPEKQKMSFFGHGQDMIAMGWNAAIEEIEK